MKLCYVDETGTDGRSPVVVMVGVIADAHRIGRTRDEFADAFARLSEVSREGLRELKSDDLYGGRGVWRDVPGEERARIIGDFCQWLGDRKHHLALTAIDVGAFPEADFSQDQPREIWQAAALHIALQLQKHHQKERRGKGHTFLIFDENKRAADKLAERLYDPPGWSGAFYDRGKKQAALDQIIDTAFYVKSHHVGLVQMADLFAFVFRRYAELAQYGADEAYEGERGRIDGWTATLAERLIPKGVRWPKQKPDVCAQWYIDLAPDALKAL